MSLKDNTTARQLPLMATETGFSATTLTATPVNGTWFDVSGFNALRLDVVYTRVAGTAVNLVFQYTTDGGTTVFTVSGIGVAVTSTAATGTRSPYTDTFTSSSSANYDVKFNDLDYGITGRPILFRIRASITAGTTDTLTITGARTYRA